MKAIPLALCFLSFVTLAALSGAQGQHYVKGHYKTTPNRFTSDNWSSRGNKNPHTGKHGTATIRRSKRPISEWDMLGYREKVLMQFLFPDAVH